MKTIHSEHIIVVDCDETLVLWDKTFKKPGKNKKLFIDPYTSDKLYLTPHEVHIRLLRQYKGRGFTLIAWSKAGCYWTETVVKTLGINNIIDYCMTKPDKHLDDKTDVDSIIGSRVYLKPNN